MSSFISHSISQRKTDNNETMTLILYISIFHNGSTTYIQLILKGRTLIVDVLVN